MARQLPFVPINGFHKSGLTGSAMLPVPSSVPNPNKPLSLIEAYISGNANDLSSPKASAAPYSGHVQQNLPIAQGAYLDWTPGFSWYPEIPNFPAYPEIPDSFGNPKIFSDERAAIQCAPLAITEPSSRAYEDSLQYNSTQNYSESDLEDSFQLNSTQHYTPDCYTPLVRTPNSWGTLYGKPNQLFQYTTLGELNPEIRLFPEHILEFIHNHPSHTNPSHSLTIYLQTTPWRSSNRYPSAASSRCRFADCPSSCNGIQWGTYRLAFTERQPGQTGVVNPFHNAFYVHLNCMERFLDLPSLLRESSVPIIPDMRLLPEGKNRMSLKGGKKPLTDAFYRFKALAMKGRTRSMANGYSHSSTLTYALTKERICREQPGKHRRLENISLHMGDLAVIARSLSDKTPSNRVIDEGNSGIRLTLEDW